MKHRVLISGILLMLIFLVSGCSLDWLGEVLPGTGTGGTMSYDGTVKGITPFTLDSQTNKFTITGLAAGQKVIVALSPWGTSTIGDAYSQALRINLLRASQLSLQAEGAETAGLGEGVLSLDLPTQVTGVQSVTDYFTYDGSLEEMTQISPKSSTVQMLGTSRNFYVRTGSSSSSYTSVTASLMHEGLRIDLYVDNTVSAQYNATQLKSQLQKMAETFDYSIYTKLITTFGDMWDKDNNGKVILLITPLTSSNGSTLIGYFDEVNLYSKTERNYSNESDMFYFNSNMLNAESRIIYGNLAHEFQHVIFGGQKFLARKSNPYGERFQPNYSDVWINEGFAVLASHLVGYGDISTDWRIFDQTYGYFAQPQRDGLLTWDSNRLDSNYGSTGLFAFYLYDHYKGVISNILKSKERPEVTIGSYLGDTHGFQKVFRNWLISNVADRFHGVNDTRYKYNGLHLKSTPKLVSLSSWDSVDIKEMGVRYYLVEGDGQDITITVNTSSGGSDIPPMNGALIYITMP